MGVWERQLDMWDRDWRGQSYNGRSLRDELLAHPAAAASTDRNHEEYTVWGVALHVYKFKETMLAHLEGREPEFPYGDEDFPPVPDGGLTEPVWLEAIGRMDETHEALVTRARGLDETFLETVYPEWEISWGETFAWAVGHDGYHTAQIRNMKR
jgi:hypothetical protein